jgi:hypothetical protein
VRAPPLPNSGHQTCPEPYLGSTQVHFVETLHALAGRVAGTELPEEEELKVHQKIEPRLPGGADDFPKYTAAHFYAAMYVQAAIRGYLARHQMKGVIGTIASSSSETAGAGVGAGVALHGRGNTAGVDAAAAAATLLMSEGHTGQQ